MLFRSQLFVNRKKYDSECSSKILLRFLRLRLMAKVVSWKINNRIVDDTDICGIEHLSGYRAFTTH